LAVCYCVVSPSSTVAVLVINEVFLYSRSRLVEDRPPKVRVLISIFFLSLILGEICKDGGGPAKE